MNTDKQLQTVYIPTPQENSFDDLEVVHVKTGIIVDKVHEKELLCFTLEELEALLQKERREASDKAMAYAIENCSVELNTKSGIAVEIEFDSTEYLHQHYPLPQPPKQ